jgi:chemotaxis protein histidine kinase CheA
MPTPRPRSRAGGGSDSEIIKRAATALSESADDFAAYAVQDIRRAKENLAKAEADPSDPAPLDTIFSIGHNFKGTGRLFGYDLLTQISESLCDYLRDRADRPDKNLNVVKVHISALEFVVENQIRGQGGDAGKRLLAKLEALRAN